MSKGSWRRPAVVRDVEVRRNWCATFGHTPVTPEGRYTEVKCVRCDATGHVVPGHGIVWQ